MKQYRMKGIWALSGLAGAAALAVSFNAQAVPSFARQTGLPCQACHTVFPQLTTFGRDFKLNGYTLTGMQQIQSTSSGGSVKINEIPPLSAMMQVGYTHVQSDAALRAFAGTQNIQNDNIEFPQQLSFFFAGEISPHMGTFMQFTYSQPSDHFSWDNTDVRLAYHTNAFGGDTVYGLTLNNNPTVQDLWDTTPAWQFPWASSDTAPTPAWSPLIDGALAQDVVGLGAYTMIDGHLYLEVDGYRSAHLGQPGGTGAVNGGPVGTINNLAPYWRVAWQQNIGANYLEVGTFGMYTELFPAASGGGFGPVSGPTDNYTDVGVDSQWERPVPHGSAVVHARYIYEHVKGNASFGGASMSGANFQLDGTYNYDHSAALTAAYFQNTGSSALVGGKDQGYILQASYLPWENTKFTLQYTGYTVFNGCSSAACGGGVSASDNNTLYLQGWLMW